MPWAQAFYRCTRTVSAPNDQPRAQQPRSDASPGPDRAPQGAPKRESEASLAHNLGSFFGHVWAGITTPVKSPEQRSTPAPAMRSAEPIRREQTIAREPQPDGSVVLRRTTIEEVRVEGQGVRPPEAHPKEPSRREGSARHREP